MDDIKLIAKLGEKISNMCKSIGGLNEDGNNTFSKYKYISSNNLLGEMRSKLAINKLAIIPEIESFEEEKFIQKNAKGSDKHWVRTTVFIYFEIIDTETGFSKKIKWVGIDQDTGGKALGQAITECTKRFYFKLFQVSSKEEKDIDHKTDFIPEETISERLKPKGEIRIGNVEKLAGIVKLHEFKPTIQNLLKSKSVLPGQLRTTKEDEAEKVILMVEQAKGFEDSEKKEQETIEKNIENQPVDENRQYF